MLPGDSLAPADQDAAGLRSGQVDGGVAHATGHDELQTRQALKQLGVQGVRSRMTQSTV